MTGIEGTTESEIIEKVGECYARIESEQKAWYEKSGFTCPSGCGECCRNFEPDLLEGEALFMASWLLDNQPEVAASVAEGKFPYPDNNGCLFWDEKNPYHCTIYGGRAFICRLFGASCNHDKEGKAAWKPCKFYPAEDLAKFEIPLAHRQYKQDEIQQIFGTIPPAMSDLMEQAEYISGSTKTEIIREILPETIRRLLWIKQMCGGESPSN